MPKGYFTKEVREAYSKRMKKLWKDPEFRAKQAKSNTFRDEAYRKKMSESCKKASRRDTLWKEENRLYAKYIFENGFKLKKYHNWSEEEKKKEFKRLGAIKSKGQKIRWRDRTLRKKLLASLRTKEARENQSKALREKYKNDTEYREQRIQVGKNFRNKDKHRELHLIKRDIKRINDYCGVVNMSDFKELINE